MLKRKKLQVIFSTVIVMGGLVGCSKGEETKVQDTEVKSAQTQNVETKNQESDEFNIYENIIKIEYRGSDIDSAFRNPSSYTGKKFTFSGTILETQTLDDGIQVATVELDTADYFIYGDMYEDSTIVKLKYDVEAFGGERLVKDDRIAVCAEFKDIKNDSKYGDIAEFDVLSKTSIIDYLSSLALTEYFKSVGVDIKGMGLKTEKFTTYKEFEKVVGKDTAKDYGYDVESISVFSTDSGIYWLAIYTTSEAGECGIQLYSGEKDDDGEIDFEHKEYMYLDSYEF